MTEPHPLRTDRTAVQQALAEAHIVAVPLAHRFRGVNTREAVLFEGPAGWAEFGPFPEYADAEAARWLDAAIETAWFGWPDPVRDTVSVNATVPAVPAAAVGDVLTRFAGCATAKVKVAESGQSLTDDLERVAAVRDHLGPHGAIRVDANGAWSLDDALRALTALSAYDLEYAEQPCAQVSDLARLRVRLAAAGVEVLVAADESVRRAEDPLRVAREGAADLLVVKVAPLGGVRRALEIVAEAGLPVVVSSALETSVGMAAGVALAATLPELPYACGLGTVGLLAGDIADPPTVPRDGVVRVGPVAPNAELLRRWAAPPDRAAWWRERVARVLLLSR